jgi:hypothetical protein
MDELARLLNVERHLLELLLFKLIERRHLLAAGETRFLTYAEAEIDRALERAQLAELRRSLVIHDLGSELGVRVEAATLATLTRDSLEPFRAIFIEHGRAFRELAAEIEHEGLTMPSLADFCAGRPA